LKEMSKTIVKIKNPKLTDFFDECIYGGNPFPQKGEYDIWLEEELDDLAGCPEDLDDLLDYIESLIEIYADKYHYDSHYFTKNCFRLKKFFTYVLWEYHPSDEELLLGEKPEVFEYVNQIHKD